MATVLCAARAASRVLEDHGVHEPGLLILGSQAVLGTVEEHRRPPFQETHEFHVPAQTLAENVRTRVIAWTSAALRRARGTSTGN